MAGTLISTVAWTSGDRKSHEVCRLSRLDTGWELAGEFRGEEWGEQISLDYTVQMDAEWRTRLVRLRSTSSVMKPRTCTLSVNSGGRLEAKDGECGSSPVGGRGAFTARVRFLAGHAHTTGRAAATRDR